MSNPPGQDLHNWDTGFALQLAAVGKTSESEFQVDKSSGGRYLTEEYAVRKHWVEHILKIMGIPADSNLRDCFASSSNARFAKWYTAVDNALVQAWDPSEIMWCNAPWSLWPAATRKIMESDSATIAIFPAWLSKPWVQELLSAARKIIYFEIGSKVFEIGGKPVPGIRWGLYVALIVPNDTRQVASVSWSAASRRRWRRKQRQQWME